ncbi:MAG: Hydroxyacylglutathione hydrolase [uncultured bacterium (gcode 4)]|uniref:Hydroxyacylglutathione hydrolase n=1 Tax=uncultured bacterium (gcode 4) TaxID=1234023 RepID=K2G499_9BACT|nr:MAG: Hydroxyacylglutathione hydrolase [uncultured bacterium (gcode 4)]
MSTQTKIQTEVTNIRSLSWQAWNSFLFSYRNKNNIIDAGYLDYEKLTDALKDKSGEIHNLFLTHWHIDHIARLEKLLEIFPKMVCHIHQKEKIFLEKSEYNLSELYKEDFLLNKKYFANIKTFNDWDIIDWVKIIHTPGHTIWSTCFYIEELEICFTWDTMFSDAYWRTDLPTWNLEEMKTSLARLFELPPETVIYPWHMESKVLGDIKIYF